MTFRMCAVRLSHTGTYTWVVYLFRIPHSLFNVGALAYRSLLRFLRARSRSEFGSDDTTSSSSHRSATVPCMSLCGALGPSGRCLGPALGLRLGTQTVSRSPLFVNSISEFPCSPARTLFSTSPSIGEGSAQGLSHIDCAVLLPRPSRIAHRAARRPTRDGWGFV